MPTKPFPTKLFQGRKGAARMRAFGLLGVHDSASGRISDSAPSRAHALVPAQVPTSAPTCMSAPVSSCAHALVFALVLGLALLLCAPCCAWAEEDGAAAESGDTPSAAAESGDNASSEVTPEGTGRSAGSSSAANDENLVDPQLLPDSSFIYDTSIVDLSQADSYYDGQTVRVTGEVVGDRRQTLSDRDHCWITITDPAYDINNTVEIFMPDEQADRIDTYGSYGRIGTIVSVQGTFHLVCPEHDGASDVHATSMSISSRGREVKDAFEPMSFVPGLAAVGVGLLLMLALWYLRERGR